MELSSPVMASWSGSSTSNQLVSHVETLSGRGSFFITDIDILGSAMSICPPSSTVEARLLAMSSPASRTVSAATMERSVEEPVEEEGRKVSMVLERSTKKFSTLVLAASLTIELSKSRTFSLKLRSKLSSAFNREILSLS